MRRWLWEHSRWQRSRDCGHKLRTAGDPTLRMSGTVGEDAHMGVAGPVTCGSRTCPVCAAKIGAKLADQITDTLRVHRDTRYHPEMPGLPGGCVMITLTLQHHLGSVLVFLLGVLRYAWSKVSSGGGYAADAQRFGLVGWIASLEITWSRRHWFHPHLHVLALTDTPLSSEMAWELGWRWFGRWERAVKRKGANVLAEHGLHVRVCDLDDPSSGALGDYLSKVGREAVASHTKSGRGEGSFTILGLLREVIDTYEYDAMRAWAELEDAIAGKRRKFLTWSEGAQELRKRAGHRRDKDEEELAGEDEGSEDLIAVNREDWGRLVVQLEALFAVGETQGLDAVKVWLTGHGIRWSALVTAPRRRLERRPPRAPRLGSTRPPGRSR